VSLVCFPKASRGPGETMASIRETFALVDDYPDIKAVWVNIGMFGLKRHLPGLTSEPEEHSGNCLFQDAWYISAELDPGEMEDFIDDLAVRKNFFVQINKPWAGYAP
ncbi:MAG: hypothetical protein ACNA7H_10800, partial [Desulfotignum sp.]